MVPRILLFILCLLEVNRMIRGHPNQQQTIGRTITSQSRDESALVRDIPSVDDVNKNSRADTGDRDADKPEDTENNHSSRESIGNSRQTAGDPLIQLLNNVNNNNNNNDNAEDTKIELQNYSKELISFFSKENFENWRSNNNRSKEDNTQRVVFPEELISSIFNKTKNEDNKFIPVIPSECEGQTICEHAPDYPEDIFGADWDDSFLRQFATEDEPSSIANRMSTNENTDEHSLCRSTKQPVVPKIGMTTEGDYRYILQSTNLKQWYESEICIDDNKPCNKFPWSLRLGSTAKCTQQYINRKFVSLSHNGQEETKWFYTKSNCCCQIFYEK